MPALIETAKGANDLITRVNELNQTNSVLDAAYKAGNITKAEHIRLGWENVRGTIDENQVKQLQVDIQRSLSQEYTESLRRTIDYTTGTQDLSSELDILRMRTTNANDGFVEFGYAGEDVKVALQKDKEEAGRLQARFQELQSYMDGQLGQSYDDFTQKNEDLRAKGEELRAKIAELEQRKYLTSAQKEELDSLYTDLGEVSTAITENADAHDEATGRILFNMAAQKLAIDGFSEDELELLDNLALEWGLIDDKTYEASQAMATSLKEFAESGDVDAALKALQDIKLEADAIPRKININIHVSQSGVDLPKGWKPGDPRQFGGPVSAGVPYLVGEAGPEMFVPNTSGEIINNWSLTINEAGSRGNVVNDFALLKALARA
jgi:cell division septum initiation protein DivIVA